MADPQPILQASRITKSIDTGTHRVDILRDINLDVDRGQFVRRRRRLRTNDAGIRKGARERLDGFLDPHRGSANQRGTGPSSDLDH